MLEAEGIRKSYGSRVVVDDLSLTIAAGEIVGLLGPNGAGKSTTVAMLCGLRRRRARQVLVGGERLALGDDSHAAKRRIGVVPQELSLYENLGAAANLELFGALYGLGGALLRERVGAALALVGLADRARDKPSGLQRRHEAAAQHRRRARPRPRRADPRRADRRRRPAEPQRDLRQPRDAARPRQGAALHDALHGRGRAPLRPRRHHGPRPGRRRATRSRACTSACPRSRRSSSRSTARST